MAVGTQVGKRIILNNKKNMCFYVGDDWRKNPKSLIPGGSEVMVMYSNHECKVYDKIKNPKTYIDKFDMTGVIKILVDEVEVYNKLN